MASIFVLPVLLEGVPKSARHTPFTFPRGHMNCPCLLGEEKDKIALTQHQTPQRLCLHLMDLSRLPFGINGEIVSTKKPGELLVTS